jgi:hypothetical protein
MPKEKEYIDPFSEEFDEKNVVNRAKPFEDFNDEPVEDEQLGPKIVADIVSDGENLHLHSIEEDDDEYFGLIKKEDIDSGKHLVEEIEEYNHQSDINTQPNKEIENQEPQLVEFVRPEEEIQKYLQQNFKDYIKVPKISGKLNKFSETNLLRKEEVKPTGKKLEIVDNLPKGLNPKSKTSILINRDINGEIESIEVLCKCGERTLISFEYSDISDEEDDLTEIIDEPKETIPFDNLHKVNENILIANPDLLIEDLKKIEGLDEDESEETVIDEDEDEFDIDDEEY